MCSVSWQVGIETDGPHHFRGMSYGGKESDPVKQRKNDVVKMEKYTETCGGRCSFIRQRDEPIFNFCRRNRGYDALAWYRSALGVVGFHAWSGRSCVVFAKEEKDWYAEHVKLLEQKSFFCILLPTSLFAKADSSRP